MNHDESPFEYDLYPLVVLPAISRRILKEFAGDKESARSIAAAHGATGEMFEFVYQRCLDSWLMEDTCEAAREVAQHIRAVDASQQVPLILSNN